MKSSLTTVNTNRSNSSSSNWKIKQNKQNIADWFKGEKQVSKILSHFNHLIQSNNQAISSLRNELTNGATNGSLSKQSIAQHFNEEQQPSYFQAPDNSMNQTYITVSKQPQSMNFGRVQFDQLNTLNQKLESIEHQVQNMKRTETENSFNLEKRFSEKGDKSQIQKALDLSRLLVVQINQIQERFKENQKTTRAHEEKMKFLEQNLNRMDQKLTFETKQRSKSMIEQKSVQDSILHENSISNQFLLKKLETKIEQISKASYTKIEQMGQKIQGSFIQKHDEQLNQIYSRIVKLQSNSEQISTQNQSLSRQLKLQIHTVAKENKKLQQKIKKDTQLQLYKKFDSLDKLYTKKSCFLKDKQQHETQLHKIAQNITKIQIQFTSRIEKLQKYNQTFQIMIENQKSQLLSKLNKISQNQSEKLLEMRQQIDKSLNKYAKTQAMKKLFQQQSQKVYQIINANLEEQKQVNEVLCSENILGRWLWQNQQLKNGNLVAWDKEVINTLPQNFKFTSEKSTVIEISSGGIYKFELGFYSKKKPTIKVLINGKVVMSAVNSSSYVIHHSSGKLKGIEPTEMSGLTLVDFFLIPENSRIAIAYSGDVKGEGFMSIHRL